MLILKLVLLVIAILYTFANFAKLVRGQKIYGLSILVMTISLVGFLYLQFDFLK